MTSTVRVKNQYSKKVNRGQNQWSCMENIYMYTHQIKDFLREILLVEVRLRQKYYAPPSSTRLGFELMTPKSWQYISCHWDTYSNHSASSDFYHCQCCYNWHYYWQHHHWHLSLSSWYWHLSPGMDTCHWAPGIDTCHLVIDTCHLVWTLVTELLVLTLVTW